MSGSATALADARGRLSNGALGRWILPTALGVLGTAVLLSRALMSTPGERPWGMLAILYSAVLVASLAASVPAGRRLLNPVFVSAAGIAAVCASRLVVGAVVPIPLPAAAIALNVLAAVSEEAFFRRYLYGRLESFGAPVAVVTTALVFAVIHVPLYGAVALPVDLGAGLLLSWQRWASGSWAPPAFTHVTANLLAGLR